jgi:hypothetical protein
MKQLTVIVLLFCCSLSIAYAKKEPLVNLPKVPTLSKQQANVFLSTEHLGAGKEQPDPSGSVYQHTHCIFGAGRTRACF